MSAETPGTLAEVLTQVDSMLCDVALMRRAISTEGLETSDRQYLYRCFDLLDLELGAVRDYVAALR